MANTSCPSRGGFSRLVQRQIAVVACLILAIGNVGKAAPKSYQLTDLGDLPGGANSSSAVAINSLGQITGYSTATSTSRFHAFLWSPTVPNGLTGLMVDLGSVADTDSLFGSAINDTGQVAIIRNIATAPVTQDSLLWTPTVTNGTAGNLVSLGATGSNFPTGINSLGQVVGRRNSASGGKAFLWNPTSPNSMSGAAVDLPLASVGTSNFGINSAGNVGLSATASGGSASYVWVPDSPNGTTGTTSASIGALSGGNTTWEQSINDSGQIAGYATISGGATRGFLWTPATPNGTSGSIINLGLIAGATTVEAIGINNLGQVVGFAQVGSNSRAFLWTQQDLIVDLNSLVAQGGSGWNLTVAYGINALGQIVGEGTYDPDGAGGVAAVTHGFLLTPIPEPAYLLLTMATYPIAFRRRRAQV